MDFDDLTRWITEHQKRIAAFEQRQREADEARQRTAVEAWWNHGLTQQDRTYLRALRIGTD